MRQDTGISYSDLERLGWPNDLINDYQGIKLDFVPQSGTEADPNGVYVANLNGIYFDTSTPAMWFNPTPGDTEGWIQIV
jgi:hypothetical protein